jgi:hypothetical protein
LIENWIKENKTRDSQYLAKTDSTQVIKKSGGSAIVPKIFTKLEV